MCTATASSRVAALLLTILMNGGCVHYEVTPTEPSGQPPPGNGATLVGAAVRSLDPPLGRAMGGHGREGAVAAGRWNEMSARALIIVDAAGASIFMVAVDAWSVSQGFTATVLAKVRSDPELAFVQANQLIVAATHTHHSPGNVATSAAYNGYAQSSKGFDERVFDLLTTRAAEAVISAWKHRRRATLETRLGSLDGLVRNRSLDAFRRNCDVPRTCDEHAIDSRLRSLWAFDATGQVIATLVLVPAHPTTLPAQAPVYHPDFFGVARLAVEAELERSSERPVSILVNGAEGDQSATWVYQGLPEAVRLGRELASRVLASQKTGDSTPSIAAGNVIYTLAGARLRDERRVAPYAVLAASQVGGAEDGRTRYYGKLNFYEGSRRKTFRIPRQGAKAPALPAVWWVLDKIASPPRSVPLTVVRLSEALVFATLPGEFTTTQGRLVEDRLQRTLGAADVWPIGLANEYVSYFTTPAEYAAQHYEGGSTLYGPAAGDAVVEQLAQVPAGQSEELERRYRVGKRLKKMPKYPPLERETCCPYTERCNARQLLGIPETYPISCVDEGSPKRADQEDIHFEGPPGTRWTLRVDLGSATSAPSAAGTPP